MWFLSTIFLDTKCSRSGEGSEIEAKIEAILPEWKLRCAFSHGFFEADGKNKGASMCYDTPKMFHVKLFGKIGSVRKRSFMRPPPGEPRQACYCLGRVCVEGS
jgi:hypothetical protein